MIVLNSPARGCSKRAALVMVVALSAACSGGSRDDSDNRRADAEPTPVESRTAIVEQEGKQSTPQRAPSTGTQTTQGSGEVPPQILAVFQDDLARRALVKHDAITVVSATEQEWSNGAMGCPRPGEMYMQMLVPGYRVVLQAAGNKYAYHSDRRGNFIVCSNGLSFPPVKDQAKGTSPAE